MFKKLFSTPKSQMYAIIASALVLFLIVFILIAACTPDKNRLQYEDCGTYYQVTDIKNIYRGGIFMRKKITIPSEYKGKPVTTIYKIESTELQEIELPDSIETIAASAFIGMKSLKKINLPNGLKTIGYNAFADCNSLSEIELPATLTEIGGKAFSKTNLTTITIPDSVKKIGDSAFEETKLETVNINYSTTEIGGNVFSKTPYLEKIYAENNGFFVVENILLGIKSGVEKDFVIPEGIEVIGGQVITEDFSFNTITMPSTLKEIKSNAITSKDNSKKNTIKAIYFQNCDFICYKDSINTSKCNQLKSLIYLMSKDDIDTTNLESTGILKKAKVVYKEGDKLYTDVVVEEGESKETITCLFDSEVFKAYILENETKIYYNETKKAFDKAD